MLEGRPHFTTPGVSPIASWRSPRYNDCLAYAWLPIVAPLRATAMLQGRPVNNETREAASGTNKGEP